MDVTIEEFTSLSPITINQNSDLALAQKMMKKNKIRHLPVIHSQKVVGLLSERDLLANFGKPWSNLLRVKDIMSTSILTANIQDSLGEVAYRLSVQKKGSAIVFDNDNKLYGIFTTTDALNALVELICPEANAQSIFKENKGA